MKQVSKMIYRISLKSGATELIKNLALTAARSNGEEAPISFSFMGMMAESIKKLDNQADAMTVTVQEEDKWLCIDMKSPQWEGYKTVLKLELVEVMELVLEDGES
jgi:ABC-type phosphate transport system permease subunit